MTNAANPLLIELASQGVSVETMAAACVEAKRMGSTHLKYAVKVIETWAREASALRVVGAAQPQQSGRQVANEQAHAWAAKLTGKARNEQHHAPEFIDINAAPGVG